MRHWFLFRKVDMSAGHGSLDSDLSFRVDLPEAEDDNGKR